MRFYKLNSWDPNFKHDGLLYFTQRIQEMLFYYSAHIYKTPVLNTYLLVREYLNVAELVKSNTINENHLKYIMDEFQDTFSNDLIIREYINEDKRADILQKINSATTQDQVKIMSYLLNFLGDYNRWCIEYLKKIVPQEKEKKKIERALRCLIPGLIGAGYSHEFIFYYNRFVFSDSKVDSIDSLSKFLDRFDFKKRQYDIYLAINKDAFSFRDILERHLQVIFDIDVDVSDLKYDRNKYNVIKMHVKAFDERSASNGAYEALSLFFRYYNFIGDQKLDWLFNTCKVIDANGQVAFVNLHPEGFDYSNRIENESAGKISATIISTLLANERNSFVAIDRAIKMHNVAIAEKDLRNGFLNLWSVFEILFVSEQAESKSAEIEKKVLPILQRDYLCFLIEDLGHNLKENLENEKINELKNKVGKEEGSEWLSCLLFLPQFSSLRTEVYGWLKDYPLLRSRMSQISNDFAEKKNVLADIERFRKRISWHFKRLYRTRNSIIHAGENPPNLKELGEHLHSYVDECLLEIVTLLVSNHQLQNIDNAIIDIQFREDAIKRCLHQKGKIDEDSIGILFK